MLSNHTLLETRIQQLFDGLIFVEKEIGVHVQRMLEMSRCLYTFGNFKQVAQWATIAHLGDTIMFGDIIIYDAQRQVTLHFKQ